MRMGSLARETGLGVGVRRKNRTRVEIAASMLEIAKQGVRKTQLMYLGNLSFELLQKYLDALIKADLIEQHQDGNMITYRTTQRGLQFLKDYQDLQKYATMLSSKRNVLEKFLSK
ncbi:MAG: winged helix-turn-helix domain-containing protein [Thermoproteota archaeon]